MSFPPAVSFFSTFRSFFLSFVAHSHSSSSSVGAAVAFAVGLLSVRPSASARSTCNGHFAFLPLSSSLLSPSLLSSPLFLLSLCYAMLCSESFIHPSILISLPVHCSLPGCQFNRLKNRLKNCLKKHLRSKFDSVTCLNYPLLVFSQYRKSQVVFQVIFKRFFKPFFSLLNWHPGHLSVRPPARPVCLFMGGERVATLRCIFHFLRRRRRERNFALA